MIKRGKELKMGICWNGTSLSRFDDIFWLRLSFVFRDFETLNSDR